jgi:hypothetical protein
MEKEALPFAVREFMVKCWKRHRDVPTTIDQVVDQMFNDLRSLQVDYKKREESNGIQPEKLMRVNSLLAALHGSVGSMPTVQMGEKMQQVQAKMAAAQVSDDAYKAYDITMQKYHHRLKKAGRLGPIPTAAYYAAMEDKNDLSRLPIMKQTRKRLLQTARVLPTVESIAADPLSTVEEYQVLEQIIVGDENMDECVEWVECVACSKWRIVPRGVVATSLPGDWTCSSGAAWRSTVLNCDIAEDEDEDVNE